MKKEKLFYNLKEWQHWLGYFILTIFVTLILSLNGIEISNLIIIEVMLGIAIVDSINHKLMLQ